MEKKITANGRILAFLCHRKYAIISEIQKKMKWIRKFDSFCSLNNNEYLIVQTVFASVFSVNWALTHYTLSPLASPMTMFQNNAIDVLTKCDDLRKQFMPFRWEVSDTSKYEFQDQ